MHLARSLIAAIHWALALAVMAPLLLRADDRADDLGQRIDGRRAMNYLEKICRFGPRCSGSPGMAAQRQWLIQFFRQHGGAVREQSFRIRHPQTGEAVELVNLIVTWHPERAERVLLCTHYDTRPFPDEERDPQRRRGTFIGANDGASGVALFCELAHHMKQHAGGFGVDFVLFDGEEFVFDKQRDRYFLGSEFFARDYVVRRPVRYRGGVLLDMIGDRELQIYQEKHSLRYAKQIVRDVWSVARELRIKEFRPRARYDVRDDHLPLNRIARIPTIDIIDFDYPRPGKRIYWHTQADTPDKCSADSLQKVGRVVWVWLQRIR